MKNSVFTRITKGTLLFLFIVGSFAVNGQTFEWIKSQQINYEYNPDMLNYVVATDEDGNVFHAGMKNFTINYSNMLGDVFINKYNTSGNNLFSVEITGNALVKHLEAANGQLILTGIFKGNLVFPGQQILLAGSNDEEFFLAIFSDEGLTELLVNLSTEIDQLYDVGIFDISDNSEIILPVSRWSDSQILKMDFAGNILQTIQQASVAMATSVDLDPSGNIIVSGAFAGTTCYFAGVLFEPETSDNMYVAKYSPNGENLWVSFALNVIYSHQCQIKCDNSGNIYFAGVLHSDVIFGELQANGPSWVYDFFLTKLSPEGEYLWLTEVPEGTITGDATIGNASFLDVDEDGNVYVSGFLRGNIDWGNGVITSGDLYYDLLILQYSPEGLIQWAKSGGSANFEKCIDLSVDSQGNCFMAGVGGGTMVFDTITHTQGGFVYPFLLKLDGSFSVDITESNHPFKRLTLFPNPAFEEVNVGSSYCAENVKAIHIFDLSGSLILTATLDSKQCFKVNNLQTGMYLVELFAGNGERTIEKLTVQ
jgi:hypothetical protein